jgi:hypothetical protein
VELAPHRSSSCLSQAQRPRISVCRGQIASSVRGGGRIRGAWAVVGLASLALGLCCGDWRGLGRREGAAGWISAGSGE